MLSAFRARSLTQRAFLCLVGAVLVVLVVLEGLNAPYLPMAAATAVSGVLCLAALVAPERLLARQVGLATAVSCSLSLVEAQLRHRPENTPGMVELCAVLLLITRAVRRYPASKAVAYAAGPAIAAVLLSLRLADQQFLVALVAVVAVPFMVASGLCLRLYDTLRAREREAIQQAQRLEHARELHDFVAHHVTAIVAQTKAARFAASVGHTQSPADLDRMLAEIERAGSAAMGSMRSMVSDLRDTAIPAATRPTGDLSVLRDLTQEFSVLGPPAALTLDPRLTGRPLSPETTTTVHRVVQESLTNVRKHATGADRVEVRVTVQPGPRDRLEVSVTDDGRGGTPAARGKADRSGYGLVGLTERVEAIGGHLTAGPRSGRGWHVLAVLPLGAAPTSSS
ncbi:sensor histidine kinase [Streptomyces noursei]|uniref:sensor histidine kinase n=1 Tax=Streptomyces noursei TaxID=1971 RepID=UPI00167A686F|nr:ATP-binding protein [Streptomyces noursei]MCZ1019046.1 histidine kinase [Streptomyces noursei]GGX31170.1 two-component sensor histidine kinase [Streptomyces noursei]